MAQEQRDPRVDDYTYSKAEQLLSTLCEKLPESAQTSDLLFEHFKHYYQKSTNTRMYAKEFFEALDFREQEEEQNRLLNVQIYKEQKSEIKGFQKKISELEEKYKDDRAKLLGEINERKDEKNSNKENHDNEIADRDQMIESLRQELKESKTMVQHYKKSPNEQQDTMQKNFKRMEGLAKKYKQDYTTAKSDGEYLEEQNKLLKQQLEEIPRKEDELRKEPEELKERYYQLDKLHPSSDRETKVEQLAAEKAKVEHAKKIADLETMVEDLEESKRRDQIAAAKDQKDINDLKRKNAELEEENKRLRALFGNEENRSSTGEKVAEEALETRETEETSR
ncbi:hypothetical protein M7I_0028 [Glarea lozoyensis 74030]|uniref:Uncharacterized protein n=1 Tax=Glarea lozoyensis (strain ATCC 74030 / MF5533) TaxID=1104152 RepID=H0EC95_GLAL7|nr:hypothetical protein M7I_0028 [Glarea lozoyensis 74030]